MSIKAIIYTCTNCGAEFRTDGPKDKIRNLALVDTTAADPTRRLCALFVQWEPSLVDRFVAGHYVEQEWVHNPTLAALCPGCAEAVYRALSAQRSGPPLDLAEPRPVLNAMADPMRPLDGEWTAAEVEDYEAFRIQHMEEVECCTCTADFNLHAIDCAYRISVGRIDAAWQAQRKRIDAAWQAQRTEARHE